jgi:hypothetical protein
VVGILWRKALLLVVVTSIVASFVLRGTREDLDMNSGRVRCQVMIGPLVIAETIHETTFSTLIDHSVVLDKPRWGHIGTTGLFGEHGRFGYAASELKRFLLTCEDSRIDGARQATLAHRLLGLLRDEQFEAAAAMIDGLREAKPPKMDR